MSALTCGSDSQPVTRRALPAAGGARAAGWAFHPFLTLRTETGPPRPPPEQRLPLLRQNRLKQSPRGGRESRRTPERSLSNRRVPCQGQGRAEGRSPPSLDSRSPPAVAPSLRGAGISRGTPTRGRTDGRRGAERRALPPRAPHVPPPRRGPRPMGGVAAPPSLCAVTCAGARRAGEAGRAARALRGDGPGVAGGRPAVASALPRRVGPLSAAPAVGPAGNGAGGSGRGQSSSGLGRTRRGRRGVSLVRRSLPRVLRGAAAAACRAGCCPRRGAALLRCSCGLPAGGPARGLLRGARGGRRRRCGACDAPEVSLSEG